MTLHEASFVRAHTIDGTVVDEWFTEIPISEDVMASGVNVELEVVVRGQDDGPDPEALTVAEFALEHLAYLTQNATRLLSSFMTLPGQWVCTNIDVATHTANQGCKFLLGFSLDERDGGMEYGYTYFHVGFSLHEQNLPLHLKTHPFKFIVEFR